MIVAFDVETRGLDATQFIIAALVKEGQKRTEYYTEKNQLWERLKQLGQQAQKRHKTLNVYAHNTAYDFYATAPLKDPNIKWHNHNPFIASYYQENTGKTKELYGYRR